MPQLPWFFKIESLEDKIRKAKNGDIDEREKIIKDYLPFIIKTVSNRTNRYIETENSPEYIIGLEAFNEAIDKYDSSKGSFINFAALVIKSRITDYMRKEKKRNEVVTLSELVENQWNIVECESNIDVLVNAISLKNEVGKLKNKLDEFNISLSELVKESPKHKKVRMKALDVAICIFQHISIREQLMKKKRLPITEITNEFEVTSKELSRYRKFIIATVIILDSNLEMLTEYILEVKGGATDDI